MYRLCVEEFKGWQKNEKIRGKGLFDLASMGVLIFKVIFPLVTLVVGDFVLWGLVGFVCLLVCWENYLCTLSYEVILVLDLGIEEYIFSFTFC